jgi:hypothetical protein
MAVSADIDGLVSASMLASVAPDWKIVALLVKSQRLLLHPSVVARRPDDLFGVDIFSTRFDNVSNHIVLFGSLRLRAPEVLAAFQRWDADVLQAAEDRLLAVPSIWARTEGGREGAEHPTSSKYKYPFGTAQILLALLEGGGAPPRLYDRHYLPWLIANCDGGVRTYTEHAYNASVWWATMAGAVGPASLTEQIYSRVAGMRPHDFIDAVNRLDRERPSEMPAWLTDNWNVAGDSTGAIVQTLRWIADLSGWGDPVLGGIGGVHTWEELDVPTSQGGSIAMGGGYPDPDEAVRTIDGAHDALNANFYHGGRRGSHFNWVRGW